MTRVDVKLIKLCALVVITLLLMLAPVLIFLSSPASAAVGGPVCNVPTDYPTIQTAVSVPTCTTVKVAPGTYSENVNITHSLNLYGAKANIPVATRTFSAPGESTITGPTDTPAITVNASNVTINGFSITNPNHGIGIIVKTPANNAVIKGNILDTIGSAAYPDSTVGVYLELGPDNVRVSDNKIFHIQSIKSAQGILIGDSTSTNPSLDARLVDNTISDITSTKGAYGIQINNGGASNSGFTTAKILSNTIKNLNGTGWVHAIGLEGKTPNVVVQYNRISNLVTASPDKTAVWFEDNAYFFTGDVNRNSLDVGASAYGIAVEKSLMLAYPSLEVDGSCNWWGAANGPGPVGPGSGARVSPGVDYSPWLRNANLNGHCADNNNNRYGNHDKDNNDYNHHSYNDED